MLFGKKKEDKEDFFDLFNKAAHNLETASELLLKITSVDSFEERKQLRSQLHDLEHNSDEITHRTMNMLNATFVTPMDREDISLLTAALDDCMDGIDEAGDLIVLYEIEDIPRRLEKQAQILQECAKETVQALPKLRKKQNIKDYTVKINSLENKGDKQYRKILAEIFSSETDPIYVIKLKDVVESLETTCDSFERLANAIEAIYIKES